MSTLSAADYLKTAHAALSEIPGLASNVEARSIAKVGVVGAGLMGAGIASAFLLAGLPVVMLDTTGNALARGRQTIVRTLASAVKREKFAQADLDDLDNRLTLTNDYQAFTTCDLVVEAVFERMDVKHAVFAELARVTPPGVILASNTSSLDIDSIATASGRPGDVVGLHFFSPAHVMPLLEIVRGKASSPETMATALAVARRIRKIGVVVGNCFGFAANRSLMDYSREATLLMLEGAEPQAVDAALTGFGFPMGPAAMADMAGVDIGVHVHAERLALGLTPDNPRMTAIANALVAAGRLGQKTGSGLYDYGADGRTPLPSKTSRAIIDQARAALGMARRDISADEIVERCIYAAINACATIVDEGIVARAGDMDLIWLYGYGFPAARGGPLYHANEIGLPKVLAGIERFHARDPLGDAYWRPAPLLKTLAADGRTF